MEKDLCMERDLFMEKGLCMENVLFMEKDLYTGNKKCKAKFWFIFLILGFEQKKYSIEI